jgi:hypothetical protein
MRPQFNSYEIATFLSRIDMSGGPDACWPTTQSRDSNGYGRIRFVSCSYAMHRLVYELVHGDIPPDMLICHTCDNPPCCNPAHLFVGSQYDNAMDRERKQRLNHPRGESHAGTNLTEAQVLEIRSRWPGEKQSDIGADYGVGQATVWRIIHKKVWTHI